MRQGYDDTRYTIAFVYVNNLKTGIGLQKTGNKELEKAILEALTLMHDAGTDKALLSKYDIDPDLALPPELVVE